MPKWIRFFSWVLLLFALGIVLTFVGGIIGQANITLYFLGLYSSGSPYDPLAIVIEFMVLLFGVTAYGLLWGKKWGINLGLLCGVLGVIIPVSMTIYTYLHSRLFIGLDFIFAIPFLIRLFQIRNKWNVTAVPEEQRVELDTTT